MQHLFWRSVFAFLLFFYPAWCLLYPFSSRNFVSPAYSQNEKYEHKLSREFRKISVTSSFLQFFLWFLTQNRKDDESRANLLALHYIVCVSGETEGLQLGWQYPQKQWGSIYLTTKEEEAFFTPGAQVSLAMEFWLSLLWHTSALSEIQLPTSITVIFSCNSAKSRYFSLSMFFNTIHAPEK